jgi:hypothetical protein
MPFCEKGDVCICLEEADSGFPLWLIPGGAVTIISRCESYENLCSLKSL